MERARVERVEGATQDFFTVPWSIYEPKGSSKRHRWVPPLRAEMADELRRDDAFFEHGEAALFVAYRGAQAVGRISASIDRRLAKSLAGVGHFGYFDCIDDPEIARALFAAAEAWLADKRVTAVHGPVNWTIYRGYRMQVQGFDLEPFIGEPRDPDYYPSLLESCGYRKLHVWGSQDIPPDNLRELGRQMAAEVERIGGFDEFTYEPFDPTQMNEELATIYPVFMDAFSKNYGFFPVNEDVYARYNRFAARILAHEPSIKVRDRDGTLVAFNWILSNPIEPFLRANGDGARLPDDLSGDRHMNVVHTVGVRSDQQHRGLFYKLVQHICEQSRLAGYGHTIGALVKEGRSVTDRVVPVTRRYAIFAKATT